MNGCSPICHDLHIADLGDVAGARRCGTPCATQLLGTGFSLLKVARDNQHFAAVPAEDFGDALADAFARSGDNHGPACNRCEHDFLPRFFVRWLPFQVREQGVKYRRFTAVAATNLSPSTDLRLSGRRPPPWPC